jgi:hypothetical protein
MVIAAEDPAPKANSGRQVVSLRLRRVSDGLIWTILVSLNIISVAALYVVLIKGGDK